MTSNTFCTGGKHFSREGFAPLRPLWLRAWIHVPLGLPFLSEGVHLRLEIEGKNMFTYRLCDFEIFIHSSVNIIFKIMLIGKYIFVIFINLLVIRNFRGICSSIEMLKGYMARESLGTPVLNLNLGNSDSL